MKLKTSTSSGEANSHSARAYTELIASGRAAEVDDLVLKTFKRTDRSGMTREEAVNRSGLRYPTTTSAVVRLLENEDLVETRFERKNSSKKWARGLIDSDRLGDFKPRPGDRPAKAKPRARGKRRKRQERRARENRYFDNLWLRGEVQRLKNALVKALKRIAELEGKKAAGSVPTATAAETA